MIYIISILFLIFIILNFSIEIKFIFNYAEQNIKFRVYIFKFDITKFIKSRKKKSENKSEEKRLDFQISLTIFFEILNKIRFLKRKPKFRIKNYTEFGLEDADIVAILYGYLITIFNFFIGAISIYVDLDEVDVKLAPKYNCNFLKFYFEGILKIRIAKIIYISFLFITLGRKFNGSTSNRKFNEKYT